MIPVPANGESELFRFSEMSKIGLLKVQSLTVSNTTAYFVGGDREGWQQTLRKGQSNSKPLTERSLRALRRQHQAQNSS